MLMASSIRNVATTALVLLALMTPAAAQLGSGLPISLDADSSSFDRRTNQISFQGLRITQGALGIEAERAWATGLDFENSEWRFRGNVRITIESAIISSTEAELKFEANQLKTADLTGQPAEFRDIRTNAGEVIHGQAEHFTYDNAMGTIRMSEAARITEGPNEIRGCDLLYDVLQEKITVSSAECDEPVSMTILPPTTKDGETENISEGDE
jgi:lipopolysaccharide transport protein LptA